MKYTQEHEWVRLEGDVALVGISKYAAEQLGDVVYVELPALGLKVTKGGDMAVVESAKAASDVYAPIAGEVVEQNTLLLERVENGQKVEANYDLVNQSPESDGWFLKLKPADLGEIDGLMDAAAYAKFVEGLA